MLIKSRCLGAACVVAGTAIGAGVLVLPLVCANVSFLSGFFYMLFSWFVAYFTALVALELNLQAGFGHTLGALGKRFSGRGARILGDGSVKLLCYLLFIAYLCGAADVSRSMLESFGVSLSGTALKHVFAGLFVFVLTGGVAKADRWNRILFAGIVLILVSAVCVLAYAAPMQVTTPAVLLRWSAFSWGDYSVLPVLFTSFGFQVIFHTLTDYCENDKESLKKAFFWGSFLPFLFYFIWTFGALYVIAQIDRETYIQLLAGKATLTDLMGSLTGVLHKTSGWFASILRLVFSSGGLFLTLSLLAILTSMIGVALGLATSWESILPKKQMSERGQRFLSVLLAIIPAWAISVINPGFFIGFLAFAGCVLTFIAIFLPIYLLYRQRLEGGCKPYYPIVDSKPLQALSVFWGILVFFAELKGLL